MVDTVRTQLELLTTLFQGGQPDGSITSQDVRDLIVSMYSKGRQVIISELADLPTPAGATITLETGVDYLFVNDINLGVNVLLLNDGTSISASSPLITIQTSSATALLTTTEALELSNITLYNTAGPCLNLSATGTNSISLSRIRLLSTTDDNIGGSGAGLILNDVVYIGLPGGLILTGAWVQVLLRGCIWGTRPGTGTALTLNSGFSTGIFNISETQFNMTVSGQTAMNLHSSIVPTSSGQINNCIFAIASGAIGIAAGGVTNKSTNWTFENNKGIVNTPVHGWENVVDSVYHVGNKRSIADGVRTALTVDALGGGTNSDYVPKSGSLWNSSTNKITPQTIGSCYDLRLQLKTSYDAGAAAHLDLEIDIGGGLGVVFEQHEIFSKGSNVDNQMAFSIPIFTLDTFIANGGTIYITPQDSAIKIWDAKLFIVETFDPEKGL